MASEVEPCETDAPQTDTITSSEHGAAVTLQNVPESPAGPTGSRGPSGPVGGVARDSS